MKEPSKTYVIKVLKEEIDYINYRMSSGFDWNDLNHKERNHVIQRKSGFEKAIELIKTIK